MTIQTLKRNKKYQYAYLPNSLSLYLFVESMTSTEPTILFKLKSPCSCLFVFCCRIISSSALTTSKLNNHSHSITSLITPAPTVLPPSRIANLNSCCIAIGIINSPSMLTLSPGITISTPSGSFTDPVTSVVLK